MRTNWLGFLFLQLISFHPAFLQEFHSCGTYDGAKYPDPRSCYSYYECHNGVSIRKVCSFGMVYNCFFKFCTFKAFAPCCRYDPKPPPTENGCLNLGIKIPNPFICNKYFECRNWKIVERTCPRGTRYDFISMSCVDSQGCRCAPGTVIDNTTTTMSTSMMTSKTTEGPIGTTPPALISTDTTSEAPIGTTPPALISTDTTPETSSPEATTQKPTETSTSTVPTETSSMGIPTNFPTEPSTEGTTTPNLSDCPVNGVKFPVTNSCTKYYQCQNGIATLKSCRYGFFYNCFLQRCSIFTFTPCCKDDPYPIRNNDYCTNLGKRVPNPYDCTKYFQCKNFIIQEFSCPVGQLFDWIANNCVDGNTCQCIPTSRNDTHGTTTSGTIVDTTTEPWEWINTTVGSITTTHITCLECSSFTTSEEPTPQKIVTTPDTTTDISSTSQTDISSTSQTNSPLCPYDGIRFPDTKTCKNYYQCINGKPVRRSCPLGLVYNCFLEICTLRAFTPCCKYDPSLPPYDDSCFGLELVKVPNPLECNKYFQCKDFKIVEQTCPVATRYDWLRMDCVDPKGCHCAPGL